MMSEVDRIYQKYIGVFYELEHDAGTWIDLASVRYALRAALCELAGPPTIDRQGGDTLDQRQYQVLAKQIERLNDWLFEHATDLAHDPHTDTADAIIAAADRLRGRAKKLRIELAAAIDERNVADTAAGTLEREIGELRLLNAQLHAHAHANQPLITEIAGLRQQLAQMDADNARLTDELRTVRSSPHGNRDGAITEDFGTVITNPPTTLTPMATANTAPGLSWPGELADWVEGLEKGRHDWRKLAKSVRWQLIANVVNQVKDSVQFDAQRPAWMSTSRAAALTFGDGRWDKVVERAHAGEVAP